MALDMENNLLRGNEERQMEDGFGVAGMNRLAVCKTGGQI